MRFARWTTESGPADGVIVDDRVVGLPDGMTVNDLVDAGLDAALAVGERLHADVPADAPFLADVALLPPVVPPAVRDFVTFEEHVAGMGSSAGRSVSAEWYEAPTFYFTNPHSLIGSGGTVVPPKGDRLDFELEVGAVIGRVPGQEGRDLTPTDAQAHIFGFTIFNDWSARDVQMREMKVGLGPCKGKDFGTTLGPWLTTIDEVADRFDGEGFLHLDMSVSVNGRELGRDSLSNMGWPFRELVAYASRASVIVPGDVLGSGTAGSGCLAEMWGRNGRTDPPALRAGDEVVMTVEGLGTISNTVGAWREPAHIPPARNRPGSPAAQARARTYGGS